MLAVDAPAEVPATVAVVDTAAGAFGAVSRPRTNDAVRMTASPSRTATTISGLLDRGGAYGAGGCGAWGGTFGG